MMESLNPEKYTNLNVEITLLLETKQYKSAHLIVDSELDKNRHELFLWILKGQIYHRSAEYKEAVVSFTKALMINSSSKEALTCLAIIFCELGHYNEAEEVYEKLQALQSEKFRPHDLVLKIVEQHFILANLYLELGHATESLHEIKRGLSLDQNNPYGKMLLAKTMLQTNQLQSALSIITELLESNLEVPELFRLAGLIYYREKNYSRSRTFFEKALRLDTLDIVAKIYLRLFG